MEINHFSKAVEFLAGIFSQWKLGEIYNYVYRWIWGIRCCI